MNYAYFGHTQSSLTSHKSKFKGLTALENASGAFNRVVQSQSPSEEKLNEFGTNMATQPAEADNFSVGESSHLVSTLVCLMQQQTRMYHGKHLELNLLSKQDLEDSRSQNSSAFNKNVNENSQSKGASSQYGKTSTSAADSLSRTSGSAQ
jgi:hypothetical protein